MIERERRQLPAHVRLLTTCTTARAPLAAVGVLLALACAHAGPGGDPFAMTKAAHAAHAQKHQTSYDAWLREVGLDRILAVHAIRPASVLLPPDDFTQEWTLELLLRGAGAFDQSLAHEFWTRFREVTASGGDVEQRLLFRFAHELGVPVTRARVQLRRFPDDTCWLVTVGVSPSEGLRSSEHTCVSVTVIGTANPSVLAPIRDRLWAQTHGSAAVRQTTADSLATVMDAIEAQLMVRYTRGRARVTLREPAVRQIEVDRVKNEVLTGKGRWEKLTIVVVAVPRTPQEVRVVVNVDGQLAPGIGDQPPDDAAYRDMEPTHAAALQAYTSALVTALTSGGG
ncbi:MAG TPA: hypothetical protein VF698_07290 [Thermoanaerobaculia bacterium]|jgi:hypothetical protein